MIRGALLLAICFAPLYAVVWAGQHDGRLTRPFSIELFPAGAR